MIALTSTSKRTSAQSESPYLQENHVIETCKEEECAVTIQEKPLRGENGNWNIWRVFRPLGPIAAPIRKSPTNSLEAINIMSI
jgi:hypothetical protein